MIRPANSADAAAIAAIYNHYIETTTVTFEEQSVTADTMAERIERVGAKFGWLVFDSGGQIAGYCYATPWRERSAYRHSVESTVYVLAAYQGQGIGTRLYEALLENLRALDVRVVLAGIALPNQASVALHERLGFEQVAHLKQVGRKFERWIDVGYWERMLDPAD